MRIPPRFWLPAILLGAFAVRLYRLGAESLWYDETVSLYLARQDLVSLTRHTAGDIHPPLYYYLLHFWGQAVGWSQFAAAFLSVLFGMLLIALVYRVGREWINPFAGTVAALLVAASPYNLWYSQEVRMYTTGATLGLASTYWFVRMLSAAGAECGRPGAGAPVAGRGSALMRDFVLYALASALGMYTLYYFAFLLVFQNMAALAWVLRHFYSADRRLAPGMDLRELRLWIASQLAVVLLYLPWIPIAVRQATDPPVPPWRSFTPLPEALAQSLGALSLGQSLDLGMTWPIVFFILVLIAFATVRDLRQKTDVRRLVADGNGFSIPISLFLIGYCLVPVLVIFGLSFWKPLYHVRYVFLYSPGFYLLWAFGFDRLASLKVDFRTYAPSMAAGGLLLVAAIGYSDYNFWFGPKYADDDLRGAITFLGDHWRPGDAVLLDAGYTYTAFVYYFNQPIAWMGRLTSYPPAGLSTASAGQADPAPFVLEAGSIGGAPNLGWGDPASDFYATTADETRAALDRVFATHPRVWMLRLYDTVVDPDGVIRNYLATRGRIIDDQGFAGESFARVQGYLTTTQPAVVVPASATRRDVLLGHRLTLLAFEPAKVTLPAGAALDVDVYWQAHEATNVDEHLYLGLYSADGKPVASSDEAPLGNAFGTARWAPGEVVLEPVRLWIPSNELPGDYVLRVAMYNPLTNEPLDAGAGEWVRPNGQVLLTDVHVER